MAIGESSGVNAIYDPQEVNFENGGLFYQRTKEDCKRVRWGEMRRTLGVVARLTGTCLKQCPEQPPAAIVKTARKLQK